jgi:hypothetical protein
VSKPLFKTFADLASGQFTAAWAFVGDAPEPLEASTGIVAQAQVITKNINLEGHAAIDVEQALPVSDNAAATSVAGLFKRFDNAQMTYYDVGLGACGWSNQPSDFVVAVNTAQYRSARTARLRLPRWSTSALAARVTASTCRRLCLRTLLRRTRACF